MRTKTLLLLSLTVSLAFVTLMPTAAADDCEFGMWTGPCTVRCIWNGEDGIVQCVLKPYQCPPMC